MMRKIAIAMVLSLLALAAQGMALTCSADSTMSIELNGQQTVTITCSSFSGETVAVSGTFTQTCFHELSEEYPATTATLSQSSPSDTVTFVATSMACQNDPDDRKVTWRFTPSSGSVADAYTTFSITSPLSISAAFTNTSLQATAGGSVSATLQVSTTSDQDINNIDIDVSGSSADLGMTDKSISKIEASSGEKTQQVSWTLTAPSTVGSYTLSAVVTSQNADSDSASATLTVAAAAGGGNNNNNNPTGGSGGGGGSGGVAIISETQTLGNLLPGQASDVTFLDTRLDVETIKVYALQNVSNVVMSVSKRQSAPSTEETVPSNYETYAYITISALNLPSTAVQKAEIDFKVNKTWLSENSLSAGDIILLRFSDGVWAKLVTNLVRQDSSFAYYRAETPGFSVFAIAVEKSPSSQASVCGDGTCSSGEICPLDCTTGDVISDDGTDQSDQGVDDQSTAQVPPGSLLPPEIGSYSWIFVVVIAVVVVVIIFEVSRKKKVSSI